MKGFFWERTNKVRVQNEEVRVQEPEKVISNPAPIAVIADFGLQISSGELRVAHYESCQLKENNPRHATRNAKPAIRQAHDDNIKREPKKIIPLDSF